MKDPTFLFTDIEGSTELLRRLGTGYATVLERHRRTIRAVVSASGGHEVDTAGDAFFVVFDDSAPAVNAALAAQLRLAAENRTSEVQVKVRMGLHTGSATLVSGGYVGLAVHQAARICHAAHGGQVLVSEDLVEELPAPLPAGAFLIDLGFHRLKDFEEPRRLYQLAKNGLAGVFPPPRTLPPLASGIPAEPNPLVGRSSEIDQIVALLLDPTVRLLTLVGPGGVGKTRLAVEAARRLAHQLRDGVAFVSLAPITDPAGVTAALAETLGLTEMEGRQSDPAAALSERQLLVVLDNFEHLLAATPIVLDLLKRCPSLKLLATSRAALRLTGERELQINPMSLPPLDGKFSGAELSRFDAPALFASRARDVLPDFQLDDSNAIVISAICRRLDGLPLALELAAARLKLFSLENLLSRLDNALDTLGIAARDRPDRQQTIRAAIAWSYNLLAPAEQSFLEQMSIFSGGFALDSAEAVGVVPNAGPIELLGSLLDNSLVRRIETAGDEPRFGMLELVRQFARSKLQRRADARAVQNRLAEHFLEVAATTAPELASANRERALSRLSQDNDNLEQALTHLLGLGDADAALRLAADLSWYWYHVGRFSGGRTWLSRCLALDPASSSPAVRATALAGSARLARYQLDMEPARDLARKAIEQANMSSDDRTIGYALYVLGLVEQVDADPRAVGHAQLAAQTLRRAGDAWGEALALFYTGAFAIFLGPREVVRPALDESGRIFREMGDGWGLAGALFYLGMLDQQEGETVAARRLIEESVELFRKSGDRWRLQTALDFLARLVDDAGGDASGIRAEVTAIRRDLGIKQS